MEEVKVEEEKKDWREETKEQLAPKPRALPRPHPVPQIQNQVKEKDPDKWICKRCKYEWEQRRKTKPVRCPRCMARLDWGRWRQY